MRGPLTALRFAVRRLAGSSDATTISVLEDETARLEEMAREFAEFGRLPEGPESEIDMTELIEGAVTAAVPSDMAVSKAIQPGLTVTGHYEPLRRAIQNLLRNATEVTDDRGISVVAEISGSGVQVSVRDFGQGVPEELRDRIFEPYFTAKAGGTGLGLALVRQTVEAHGGAVEVRTADECGAEFVITIPEAR
jgi:signal transduction histidine kinase